MFEDNNENKIGNEELNKNESQSNRKVFNYYDDDDSSSSDEATKESSATSESDNGYSRSYYRSSYDNLYSSQPSGDGKKPKKNKSGFGKKLAVVASLAIVGGGLAGASFEGVRYLTSSLNQTEVASVSLQQTEGDSTNGEEVQSTVGNETTIASTETTQLATTVTDVSSVVETVMPSVVSITNMSTTQIEVPSYFGGYGSQGGNVYEQEQESSGSGIIIAQNDTELLIVTNNHVVADATTLSVGFADGSIVDAKIKGTDADSDLAVIAVPLENIESSTLESVKIAELGDSSQLKVGEAAIAIGNALGYGQSVTTGVISAVDREVTVDNVTNSLIQTDAAINPGNSGGALLNMSGQVIGINSVKYSSTEVEGMGYAIPISTAIPIINELVTKETRDKVDTADTGYLGIAGVDVSEEAASTYNMPTGVYVAQVVEGGAAEAAGIQKGDIITKFDGSSVSSMESLQDTLQYYAAGTTVTITVQTAQNGEYQEKELSVTLGRKVQ
ncbi:S1C family serine protease [Konateibacter massiliensis]|uniref:S1C family serine protease n=1 Tax=Konateibacter massiliensis TaxID=2002841 RepID=UPI000C15DEC6|nr:trypsin-like peptidase domain-containing protein [Konateibacter massiliensis]